MKKEQHSHARIGMAPEASRVREALRPVDRAACLRLRERSAMAHRVPDWLVSRRDPAFRHLLLQDAVSGQPLATMAWRQMARPAGTADSLDEEFDTSNLLPPDAGCLEVDGPCALAGVSATRVLQAFLDWLDARSGGAFGMLVRLRLPLAGGDRYVQTLVHTLRESHGYREQARPRVPLRQVEPVPVDDVVLPSRLQAWLRHGARLVSAPAWDALEGHAVLLLWRPAPAPGVPAGTSPPSFQSRQAFPQAGDLVQ